MGSEDIVVEANPVEEAPVENEATSEKPVDDESTEKDAEVDDKKADDEVEPEHKSNRVQKRIDKLTRDKYELKGRLDMLERVIAQQNQEKPAATDKPDRASYEHDEEYVEALTDWMVNKKLSNVKNEINEHQTSSQLDASWSKKVTAAQSTYADYDEVMEDAQEIAIPQHLQVPFNEALKSSDLGADIVYHLAKNPDEATRIFSLSTNAAIREIGKLESKLETAKLTKPVVKQTKASAPIQLPKASGSKAKPNIETMSVAEYKVYRNKQLMNKTKG